MGIERGRVVFCPAPSFLGATIRQYDFMLKGLQEVEKHLEQMNIPFYLLEGYPEKAIPDFLKLLFLDNCPKLQEDERQKKGAGSV